MKIFQAFSRLKTPHRVLVVVCVAAAVFLGLQFGLRPGVAPPLLPIPPHVHLENIPDETPQEELREELVDYKVGGEASLSISTAELRTIRRRLDMAHRFGPSDHLDEASCFHSDQLRMFSWGIRNNLLIPRVGAASTCDDGARTHLGPDLRSTAQCSGMSSPFGFHCQFTNVCYMNQTILMFGDSNELRSLDGAELFPGVGHVVRNNAPMVRLSLVPPNGGLLASRTPCLVQTPSFVFSRIYNNFYYTLYGAASLHLLLRQLDPTYPTVSTQGSRMLFLSDTNPNLAPAATGLFEMFSRYEILRLTSADEDPDRRFLCFKDVHLGFDSNNFAMGDDLMDLLRSRFRTMRSIHKVTNPLVLHDCTFNDEVEGMDDDSAEPDTETDGLDSPQSTPNPNPASAIELAAQLETASRLMSEPVQQLRQECRKIKASTSTILGGFIDLVLHKHGLSAIETDYEKDGVVVVTLIWRDKTRRILNQDELARAIKDQYGDQVRVDVVLLETLSFHEQMATMRNTNILIGMHGAAWVNLMWTNRESSVLIEMFPYQHNKDTYKLHKKRFEWRNQDQTKATFTWTMLAKFGMTEAQKERFLKKEFVPPGLSDKLEREFWKSQDTEVEVESFMETFQKAWDELQERLEGSGGETELEAEPLEQQELALEPDGEEGEGGTEQSRDEPELKDVAEPSQELSKEDTGESGPEEERAEQPEAEEGGEEGGGPEA